MARRKPIRVEIVEDGEARVVVRTFADGTEEREPIVPRPRRMRYPPRPYWHWKINGGGEE